MKAVLVLLSVLLLTQATFSFDFDSEQLAEKAISFLDFVLQRNKNLGNDSCTKSCCASLPSRGAMTYHYYQNTGRFVGGSGNYAVNTHAYSGQGEGYNNPAKQCVVNTGPLPATTYKLGYCVNVMHETTQRPCAFYLEPQKPSEMCGRSAFFIHGCACCTSGDDTNPPTAGCSAGCVVLSYANRLKLRVGDTLIVEHFEPKALPAGLLQE
jgi:hypothetical protein